MEWLTRPDRLLPGFQLESVTLFQGYSSTALPLGFGRAPFAGSLPGYDLDFGGSATFGWRRAGPRTNSWVSYSLSYERYQRHPEWNTPQHDLSFGISRSLSRRWNMALDANTSIHSFPQFFFDPPVLRPVSDPPTNFEDLTGEAAAGRFSNDELASILTGAPVVESVGRTETNLSRSSVTTLSTSVSYSHSPRLSIDFSVGASRYRFLSGRRDGDASGGRVFFPGGASASAGLGLSYRLSRQTSLGATFSTSRSFSPVQDGYYTTEQVSLTRSFLERWSVTASAGSGTVHGVGLERSTPSRSVRRGVTWVASTSLSYNGRGHSLAFAASRNVGDSFGLAARTTISTAASWSWQKPGRHWMLDANASRYHSSLVGFQNLTGWWGGLGFVRILSPHTSTRVDYGYGNYSSQFTGIFGNFRRHRVQISLSWSPGPRGAR